MTKRINVYDQLYTTCTRILPRCVDHYVSIVLIFFIDTRIYKLLSIFLADVGFDRSKEDDSQDESQEQSMPASNTST